MVEFRTDENFEKIIDQAKEITETLCVEVIFQTSLTLRRRLTSGRFDYEKEDQALLDPATSFKDNFFSCILDQALSSVEERFDLLNQHVKVFKFVYWLSQTLEKIPLTT